MKPLTITVASGKGGVGKTMVATNLALSAPEHVPTQLVDCDVDEPDAHLFLRPTIIEAKNVEIPVPVVDQALCNGCGSCADFCAFNAISAVGSTALVFPDLCHGCGGCKEICPTGAISEAPNKIGTIEWGLVDLGRPIDFVQGRLDVGSSLSARVIKSTRRIAQDRLLDAAAVRIIDAPPGTSCPVVASVSDSDYSILVAESTPFGLHDLSLVIELVRELNVPFGVVINRDGIGDDRAAAHCRKEQIPILARIPFQRRYADAYAGGILLVDRFSEVARVFHDLWERLLREVER